MSVWVQLTEIWRREQFKVEIETPIVCLLDTGLKKMTVWTTHLFMNVLDNSAQLHWRGDQQCSLELT